MSPRACIPFDRPGGFPRVSGDEPVQALPPCVIQLFSPRERG